MLGPLNGWQLNVHHRKNNHTYIVDFVLLAKVMHTKIAVKKIKKFSAITKTHIKISLGTASLCVWFFSLGHIEKK